jgi:HAMP domain-containing protein
MNIRFAFFASVSAGIAAAAAMGGALWIVTSAYGELGDALEQRKQHLHASAELVRLMQPVTRADAEAANTQADSMERRWQASGASDEELKLLRETLAARLQPHDAAAATVAFEPLKGDFAARGAPAAGTFGKSVEYEAAQAKRLSEVNRLIAIGDARTTRGVDAAWQRLGYAIGVAIGAVALMLLLTIAGAVALKRSMLRPIRRLAREVEDVDRRQSTTPLDPGTRIAEFQAIATAYNELTQTLEREVRARLRMTVELQKARAAADSAERSREALLARLREREEANAPQSMPAPLDRPASPRGSKRRRRNQNV